MTDTWISEIGQHRFKKYSQCGEEGFIRFILSNIGYNNKFLVDIGAWDGTHLSNSKLFVECGYTALLIDGDNHGNPNVKKEWITRENVCDVLAKYDCPKEFSLLSYDTDGNDFDILLAILTNYKPDLVVCEINGSFPLGVSKKMVYNPSHVWNNNDYFGFSYSAALKLAEMTGYKVVFQNDSINVYMVRKELLANPEAEIQIPFAQRHGHPHKPDGLWENV